MRLLKQNKKWFECYALCFQTHSIYFWVFLEFLLSIKRRSYGKCWHLQATTTTTTSTAKCCLRLISAYGECAIYVKTRAAVRFESFLEGATLLMQLGRERKKLDLHKSWFAYAFFTHSQSTFQLKRLSLQSV